MAASSPVSRLPSLLLLLTLLGIPGVEGQEVQQPPGPISVLTGEDVILGCQLPSRLLAGPVKWFMGKGPTRKLIYSDSIPSDRVTRAAQGSNTDFSIVIHNVGPEDTGTYYCVKQIKLSVFGEEDFESGGGTEVVVRHHGALSSLVLGIFLFLGKIPAAFFLLYLFIKRDRNRIRLATQAGVASRK